MKKELAKRLAQMLLVLFGVTVLVYGLMDLAPGDPAQRKLTAGGVTVTKEVLEQTREDMGLNRPFPVRYGDWLLHVLRGDLGTSYRDGQPVMKKLGSGLHGTALLASCSLLLSIIFGIFKFPEIFFLYTVSVAELSSFILYSHSSVLPTIATVEFISLKSSFKINTFLV